MGLPLLALNFDVLNFSVRRRPSKLVAEHAVALLGIA